jgi:outer membrane lipoprotein LolB
LTSASPPGLGRGGPVLLVRAEINRAVLRIFFITMFLIAGCASVATVTRINHATTGPWSGRISIQILSEPAQAFSAGFELEGGSERGRLLLTNPLGNTLGVMSWSPGEAVLESGGQVKRFASMDAMLEATTGAAVPLNALFDWLDGKATPLNGWTADLSRQPAGKIAATRELPAPQVILRMVLDR